MTADVGAAMRQAADRAAAALLAGLSHRPGARYEAALLRVVCPEQDGDGSPFGWFDGSELTPKGASRGLAGARTAEQASGGLREPDAETAQRGAEERRAGNGGA